MSRKATSATGVRDSSKRTARIVALGGASMLPPTLALPSNLWISLLPLPTWLDLSVVLGESSAKTTSAKLTTEQPPSQSLPALPLHRLLGSLRATTFRYRVQRRMSGRSWRSLGRDAREGLLNIRCAGRIHGCLRASWGTPGGCCGNLRGDDGHSGDANKAYRRVRTRVEESVDA